MTLENMLHNVTNRVSSQKLHPAIIRVCTSLDLYDSSILSPTPTSQQAAIIVIQSTEQRLGYELADYNPCVVL